MKGSLLTFAIHFEPVVRQCPSNITHPFHSKTTACHQTWSSKYFLKISIFSCFSMSFFFLDQNFRRFFFSDVQPTSPGGSLLAVSGYPNVVVPMDTWQRLEKLNLPTKPNESFPEARASGHVTPGKMVDEKTHGKQIHGTKGTGIFTYMNYWFLLPWKLTRPLKINGWKMYFLFK